MIADFDVPFARPRERAALFADHRFHAQRESIAEARDADTLARLAAARSDATIIKWAIKYLRSP